MGSKRLLVIQTAGLGYEFMKQQCPEGAIEGLELKKADTVFPALTCPVQASMRTASFPCDHGMVMNGVYSREFRKPLFWEQSSAFIKGNRIWEQAGKTALLFWQQSLGENTDILLSPAPIHTHGGGLVDDVFARPSGLYEILQKKTKSRFKLSSYWGPLASIKSSKWICDATCAVIKDSKNAPSLILTYLPHLDYALQKYGPETSKASQAFTEVSNLLKQLITEARDNDYSILIFGDYAIVPVTQALYPNRILHKAGLFRTRTIGRRLYPDFHYSDAFAVADHEIAHVYIQNTDKLEQVRKALTGVEGIKDILDREAQKKIKVDSENSGDLILTAEEGSWFSYTWWKNRKEAPDYATHVDIHNKPGYDPCELFFGKHPFAVSTDTSKVKGSHGRTGPGREVAVLTDIELPNAHTLVDIAASIRTFLG